MKIVITGSLGHISQPLTRMLALQGHRVTVISSNPERSRNIERLGAQAAIGSLEDGGFLKKVFAEAEAVYTMVPPLNFFNPQLNLLSHYTNIGHRYFQAIEGSTIQRVVNLSTIGGHLSEGNGILRGAHHVEEILNQLPQGISLTHLRPLEFYYNLLGFIPSIKRENLIATNYGGANTLLAWASPVDIAEVAAEELNLTDSPRKVRYVVSDELTGPETAKILGNAIGYPQLRWEVISRDQRQDNLEKIGMNPAAANGLTGMYESIENGLLMEDYLYNKPSHFGKVKMTDFARDFAAIFHQKK